jgi:hypothetical protein
MKYVLSPSTELCIFHLLCFDGFNKEIYKLNRMCPLKKKILLVYSQPLFHPSPCTWVTTLPHLTDSSTMKAETGGSFRTATLIFQGTEHCIPEDSNPHSENLRSQVGNSDSFFS